MRLYQQLVLFMLAATVLPAGFLGFSLLAGAERSLARSVGAEQRAVAAAAAETTAAYFLEAVNALSRAPDLFDWAQASPEEIRGGLSLLYQQISASAAVAVVSPDGRAVADPVFIAEGWKEHPAFAAQGISRLVEAIPLEALRSGTKGQVAQSRGYLAQEGTSVALALAVKLNEGEDALFLVMELGLGKLQQALAEQTATALGEVRVLDSEGRALVSSRAFAPLEPVVPSEWNAAHASLAQAGTPRTASDLPKQISAVSVRDPPGLIAVAVVEDDAAFAPVKAMRRTVLASMGAGLVVLLGGGLLFTRRINRRLSLVVAGAEALGRGQLTTRIPVNGADELSELAQTFNRVGEDLESARARLLTWNDELKRRVDEATAELKAAQAQLLETQKLAAIGQLGAGVAHEINNPLAGILGNTQLLLLHRAEGDSDFDMLRKIEQSAKRCKEITQNLLRFSQQRERAEMRSVDLNAVVRDALSLTAAQLEQEKIEVASSFAPGHLMVNADPGHVSQVLLALVSNARTAMQKSERKALSISTRDANGHAQLSVEDSGKGIKPEHLPHIFEPFFTTKDVWSNVGLGLSVAYRVVSEHQGRIEVTSEVGKGTVLTVTLMKS